MNILIDFFYSVSLLFSVVMSFTCRRYLRSRKILILLPYLVYVFIQEMTLDFFYYRNSFTSNSVVYNIYRPISVIVFFWIYYNIPFMAPLRKLLIWLTVVYLTITLINYCFIESIFTTSSYLTLARGFIITCYGVLFLFRYFYLDSRTEEKYWRPLIWITTAVVIFYSVVSISLSFQKYLAAEKATLYGLQLYNVIPQVMSIFMYSCFSYAFYLCKKET
jgi:hypothetical protein